MLKTGLVWCAAIVVAASLLVASDYRSRDPDSALYATISTALAEQPPSRWIAPEWGGAWNQQGLFREHPVGILLPSVVMMRAGVPASQAAYIVNMLYQMAVITLIPLVAGLLVRRVEAASLAWLLQLMPIAFVYRIRGNQEHPLLMCFLAVLYGTHRARSNPAWLLLTAAAFCFLVLVKGAFAMFTLVAAALWLVFVPPSSTGATGSRTSDRWAWVGLVGTAGLAALMMLAYEAIYVHTTGESFLEFYRSTRLGGSIELSDPRVVPHALLNVGWYLLRLAWFAAPWSMFAFGVAWVWAKAVVSGAASDRFGVPAARALAWAFLVVAIFLAVLSPALVRAERFIFPAYFIIATIGIVAALRTNGRFRAAIERTDAWWWLPAGVWLSTFLLSLGAKVLPQALR